LFREGVNEEKEEKAIQESHDMRTKIKYGRVKSTSYKLSLPLIIESPSTPMSRALWNSVNGNS